MNGAGFAAIVSRAVCLGFLFILSSGVVLARDAETDEKAPACLSGPKGTAPKGERWYYRVDRETKRHCWYTRGGRVDVRREPERKPQIAEAPKPVETPAQEPLQSSVANARAEADLSAIARTDLAEKPLESAAPQAEPPPWKLAARWSEHQQFDAVPDPVPQTAKPAPPVVLAPPDVQKPDVQAADAAASNAQNGDETLALAGLAAGLLGLSAALVAILIFRRRRLAASTEWHFAQRARPDAEPEDIDEEDQDDALPASWRDLPQRRRAEARQMVPLRESALKGTLRLPARPKLFAELPHQAADEIR